MKFLDYLKLANKQNDSSGGLALKINLVTNFTDAVLVKILRGVLLSEGIAPEIHVVPYKQYHLHLKDQSSQLYKSQADITFIFFDINSYRRSAFTESMLHMKEILSDIREFAAHTSTPIVVSSFTSPYSGVYGNLFQQDPIFRLVQEGNDTLEVLASEIPHLYICDTNALVHQHGERNIRDFRGLYAFDVPFTNEFLLALALEWASFARARLGRVKKCLVLDLDNTLWGGVVGEIGPQGIAVGPDYPGIAFQNFQHALVALHDRGIILALNSKNNPGDIDEVFEKNPHMILKDHHFAAKRINWEDKAKNLIELAEELNIGLDSMVFLDDDVVNRELVRSLLPDVLVPELPREPELYVSTLFALNVFNQFSLTAEDKKKTELYRAEAERKSIQYSAQSLDEYITALGISIDLKINDISSIERLAQLTQKTNQFNLTTRRYSEKEILNFVEESNLVFSADVSDKFGDYGKTILAIIALGENATGDIDTFLMSCRVMGRHVEYGFILSVANELARRGGQRLSATFTRTLKNDPASGFLPSLGFTPIASVGDTIHFEVNIVDLADNAKQLCSGITINENKT